MAEMIGTRAPLTPGLVRQRNFWSAHGVSVTAVALVLGGMVATAVLAQRATELSDLQSASAQARDLANQLAERTAQLVRRADQLSGLAARAPGRFKARELLVDGAEHSAVVLVDKHGIVTDSTLLPVGTDVSSLPYFQVARKNAAGELWLLAPLRFFPGGPMLLPTIRPMQDAKGAFAGAVIIAVQASHITEIARLPKHPQALFALLDDTGLVLAGSAGGVPLAISRTDPQVWQTLRAHSADEVLPQIAGSTDSALRLSTIAPVTPYRLAIMVGVPLSTATIDARKLFCAVYAAVILLSMALVAAAFLSYRQKQRLQEALDTRKLAEAALREEKEFLDVTLGSIDDAIVTLDLQYRVTFLNRRAEVMTGWGSDEAFEHDLNQVATLHALPDVAESSVFPACATSETVPPLTVEELGADGVACLTSATGHRVAVEYALMALNHPRAGAHSMLVLRDVSHATQVVHSLTYQASHDALTGLFNRTAFDVRVEQALASASKGPHGHMLLFLDLDQFKVVNDSCGHAAGDELLKQVAYLFQQTLRQSDMLARIGGDEFAILLENCAPGAAVRLADKLRTELTAFRFSWGGKNFQVGVSIGAVPVTAASGTTRDDLMNRADTACYIAKDSGRNRTHLYLDLDEAVVARKGELSWAARVQHALANGEFQMLGQRIIAPQGGAGYYYEMLLRMVEPDGSLVSPMAFLPAAEHYGMMPAIDRAVIDMALKEHLELQRATAEPVRLAINLSGSSLSDASLLDFIKDALVRHEVPAHSICFEITETVAIANLQVAAGLMQQLRELGCTLALDDFGSGMASFSYLKQLPVDMVKIDGSFVRNMLGNAVDYAMVEAVNNIAHKMGLATLAEYVETPALIQALDALGVDLLQGYGVGRPETLAEMLETVRSAPAGPWPSLMPASTPVLDFRAAKRRPIGPVRSVRSTK